MAANDSPLFCARCAIELVSGQGNLYVVKIEAIADPGPIAWSVSTWPTIISRRSMS